MHGSIQSIDALLRELGHHTALLSEKVQVVLLPPFPYLQQVRAHLSDDPTQFGAQNCSVHLKGAYTGDVSLLMLEDCGCRYVLLGHSERRQYHRETSSVVAEKFIATKQAGMIPILCVGEDRAQRDKGQTDTVIRDQLDAVIEAAGGDVTVFKQAIVAYEPLWAIGTGTPASPEIAQSVHAAIRAYLAEMSLDTAQGLPLLYGGSVKPDNALALFAMPDIDGGLVGGASLVAEQFLEIIRLCTACY